MIEERLSPWKSVDTSGSSRDAEDALHRARPRPSRKAALSSSTRGRPARASAVKSTTLTVGRRDAQAEAVELALEVGDDERERLGRAGRRRDDVLAGGAGAARILVGDVEDALVVRVRSGSCSSGRARCRARSWTTLAAGARQFVVQLALLMMWCAGRVVRVLVDAEDDRDVLALGRGADDDLLRAGVDVGAGLRRRR